MSPQHVDLDDELLVLAMDWVDGALSPEEAARAYACAQSNPAFARAVALMGRVQMCQEALAPPSAAGGKGSPTDGITPTKTSVAPLSQRFPVFKKSWPRWWAGVAAALLVVGVFAGGALWWAHQHSRSQLEVQALVQTLERAEANWKTTLGGLEPQVQAGIKSLPPDVAQSLEAALKEVDEARVRARLLVLDAPDQTLAWNAWERAWSEKLEIYQAVLDAAPQGTPAPK